MILANSFGQKVLRMSNQNEKWYKKIWLWLIAVGASILAFVRLKRTGVSGQSTTGIERLGDDIERVGESVTRTSESLSSVTDTISELDSTAQRIADTSQELSDANERSSELHNQATDSLARIEDLIRAERQRLEDLENNQ